AFTDDMFTGKLRMIAHAAGSIKNLVPASFWNTGCRLTSNAPVIAEDVAQTTLAFILCSLKSLWGFAKSTRDGQWAGGEKSHFVTRRLDGLRVGVIGASNVGREVIKILAPFRCEIVLSDPYISPMEAANLGVKLISLDELISTSDVVTIHAPPVESARHIINARTAPMLKDGALFINTARGMSVDENALIKELQTGRIFACIDVTDPEPPAPDHPFRKLENVILTPHIAGGHTVNGRHMLGENSIREVYNFLTKGLIRYDIRKEMLDLMA
ncbi:MAG: hydroxyacid dehydrogenase, partial [Treponema sp.]|nr:hydroxyacid dehydrogenase [Treponema sp.]